MLRDDVKDTLTGKKIVLLARNLYITGGVIVLFCEVNPGNAVFCMSMLTWACLYGDICCLPWSLLPEDARYFEISGI